MPWTTPSLRQIRMLTRDNVLGALRAKAMVPNSVTRIVSDAMAGLAHLCLLYVDWLAKQLLPDTAEDEWLERHGQIWLRNADGSKGRKAATPANGTVNVTGISDTVIPQYTELQSSAGVRYETTEQVTLGSGVNAVDVVAIDPGAIGNLDAGAVLAFTSAIAGVDGQVTVVVMQNGADKESIDDLRIRVLKRIQQPPMGGDATDYEQWSLAVDSVTRAWCAPQEMGIGTVTVRFMCDDLRASDAGFPHQEDIDAVTSYLDTVRPVTVKDRFVVAPIPQPINLRITNLSPDTAVIRAAIEASLQSMLHDRAKPGQEIFAAWVSEAISAANGVDYFDLTFANAVMPTNGSLATLGNIIYA